MFFSSLGPSLNLNLNRATGITDDRRGGDVQRVVVGLGQPWMAL